MRLHQPYFWAGCFRDSGGGYMDRVAPMTPEMAGWLEPMVEAMLRDRALTASFARLIAMVTSAETLPGVDWLFLGELMRFDLGWDQYPASPARSSEFSFS